MVLESRFALVSVRMPGLGRLEAEAFVETTFWDDLPMEFCHATYMASPALIDWGTSADWPEYEGKDLAPEGTGKGEKRKAKREIGILQRTTKRPRSRKSKTPVEAAGG